MLKRIFQTLVVCFLLPAFAFAQTTTSGLSGIVKTGTNQNLVGATVTATHEPTGTVYKTQTRTGGIFNINNMNPGGPYTVEVSYVNYGKATRNDIYLSLGETYKLDVNMNEAAAQLQTVTVSTTRKGAEFAGRGGTETTIGRDKVANLPTVGRNIYDYLRAVPQAKLTTAEGGVAIAGQNNRYNAFYVDGAVNNDVFGLSASGTNGGQAAIAPISIDAIDQFQVVISPYDASLGNFTGGGINAITRSGTNKTMGSIYYSFRNQNLTGKTPTGDKSGATKLAPFSNKTYGFRVGGAFVKNKLFYFLNAEQQRDIRPQPFDFANYNGDLKGNQKAIDDLRNYVKTTYGYDMGGFLSNDEKVNADRITAKLDWNISAKHKLSLSHRYTKGLRYNTTASSSTTINFYNNGYQFPTKTNSTSAELKSNVGRSSSNRLLLTYTDVIDNRDPLGSPFPRVSIFDGSAGTLVFGTENSSTQNLLTQKNYSLFDAFKFNIGKHAMSVGTDNEINNAFNAFIQNTYGTYQYSTLADFYANAKPRQYQVGYPLIDNVLTDNTSAAAKFKILKMAFFVNDEWRATENLTLNLGLRADYSNFITKPATDNFTNDSALPKFSQYYDLGGARSGLKPHIPVSLSPRIGITYKVPDENLVIRGGVGIFTGRIPLVWPGGIYNNNGLNQGGFTASSSQNAAALNTIRFRPDPYGQWRASDVGISLSKGGLNLITEEFKLPKVLRASLALDRKFGDGWTATLEGVLTKNINEIYYTNINILPPTGNAVGPDTRYVYPSTVTIPIRANGSNPYDNAILLSNNRASSKGFAYNTTFTLDKRYKNGFAFNFNYSYGNSLVINEATSSVNLSQWRFMETVNGRNYIQRSISDFDAGHRVFAFISKKFEYAKKSMATTVSLVYTGQSGAPYSYVYGTNSMVRDDGATGGNDLIFVPTQDQLAAMTFLSNTVSGVTYTPQQQKDALNAYIDADRYLSKRRGQYAERNAARLPFTHDVDLKIQQDFNLKFGKNTYGFQLQYDMFNFTNFLNRDWGRTYFLSNDQFGVIAFAGYVSATNLTPQYRFNPTFVGRSPYGISTSTVPQYSPRWVSQLTLRFNFNQ